MTPCTKPNSSGLFGKKSNARDGGWRSLKYEAVYLHERADGFQAQRVIARWMEFYTPKASLRPSGLHPGRGLRERNVAADAG